MDAAFHTKLEHDDVTWTLVCGGELDVASATRLEEAFELCESMRPQHLHIDARDLTFLDSAGVSALLRCAHRCHEAGIEFSIDVSEQARAVLARAGIAERIILGPTAPHVPA